jgi:enoyl-CoA hydratase/carnithine racemase
MSAAEPAIEDDDLIAMCYASEDFHEGLEAFLGKRKANWSGR